jgi:hypothetical protein
MFGISQKGISDFSAHQSCRLGRWYYQGEGASKYANKNSFRMLESPQEDVHNHENAAMTAMQASNTEKALTELSLMENKSTEFIHLLTTLSQEIEND